MPDSSRELRPVISREEFAALHGFELGQELIDPAIIQVRGKNLEIKRAIYQRLTPGQQSLFAFWVLYGHTQSGWLQFYLEGLSVGGYEQNLPVIKAGLRQMNEQALLENIVEAEKRYAEHRTSLTASQDVPDGQAASAVSLEKIKQDFTPLDERLFALLAETMEHIEAQIRARPQEFILINEPEQAHDPHY